MLIGNVYWSVCRDGGLTRPLFEHTHILEATLHDIFKHISHDSIVSYINGALL